MPLPAAGNLCARALSEFKPSTRRWVPISPPRCAPRQATQRQQRLPLTPNPPPRSKFSLSLITQNLDAFSSRPIARARLLLESILREDLKRPDVIFLQEVTSDVHAAILANPTVREAFLVTDAQPQDQTAFEGVPFANVILLSRERFAFELESHTDEEVEASEGERKEQFALGPVSRVELPSKYARCALAVDIIPPSLSFSTLSTSTSPPTDQTYRLINVHLDSLGDTLAYRTAQLEVLAGLLRAPGCAGGVIAGDFNAISTDDHPLLGRNGLVDAWEALHGEDGADGATWGVGVRRRGGLKAGRLDKVALVGVEVREMEVVSPPMMEESRYVPCSDHCGLRVGLVV